MEKYIAVEEMVELFNSFTIDKDPTIGGILWVAADAPAHIVVRSEVNEYGWPTPALQCFRTEWDDLSKRRHQGENMCSWGYRQEDVLEVEFYEYSTGSRLWWTREAHEIIGTLKYVPGKNTEGFHEHLLESFRKAEEIKPLL